MTGLKIADVTQALGFSNTYDIVNAIRNSGTDGFRQYVPIANAENVAEVGAGILISQATQNEFITSLVDRIGKVVIQQKLLQNPLKFFKKGSLPLGRTIEEIYVDIAEEKLYNVEEAEEKVFARNIPDVKTLFHELNRKGYYKQTVQDSDLTTAFVSWADFDSFVVKVVSALYNSAEVDEFKYMKLLIDNYMAKGHFRLLETKMSGTATQQQLKDTVKSLRAMVTRMTLASGSREYNSMGVHTRSDKDSLYLIVTPEFEAQMDVEVLAQAFNMEKATLLAKMVVVDDFATKGLLGVLVDEDFFMVYDKLIKMETLRNPEGLYWNYWLHVWQLLSASRFQNAVAFIDETYDSVTLANNSFVNEVIMTPSITTVKAGGTVQLKADPRQVIVIEKNTLPTVKLNWTVGTQDGSDLATGTAVDANGLVTVGESQTGTIFVRATVAGEKATVYGVTSVIVK